MTPLGNKDAVLDLLGHMLEDAPYQIVVLGDHPSCGIRIEAADPDSGLRMQARPDGTRVLVPPIPWLQRSFTLDKSVLGYAPDPNLYARRLEATAASWSGVANERDALRARVERLEAALREAEANSMDVVEHRDGFRIIRCRLCRDERWQKYDERTHLEGCPFAALAAQSRTEERGE